MRLWRIWQHIAPCPIRVTQQIQQLLQVDLHLKFLLVYISPYRVPLVPLLLCTFAIILAESGYRGYTYQSTIPAMVCGGWWYLLFFFRCAVKSPRYKVGVSTMTSEGETVSQLGSDGSSVI